MATNRAIVTFQDDSTLEVEKGTTLYELSKLYQPKMKEQIVGVEINNEVVSLEEKILRATRVNFIDKNSVNGYKLNKYGLIFVMEVALKETFDNKYELYVDHSIANGIHVTIGGEKRFTLGDAKKLKAKMNEIIEADEKIYNINVEQKEAINYFNKVKAPEKAINIHNLTNEIVKIYRLRNIVNYFYFEMPYSTGSLSKYDLVFLGDNKLVLLFPSPSTKYKVPEYIHYQGIIKSFDESKKWIRELGVPYLSDLNQRISDCKIEDLIMVAETNFNNQINELVDDFIKSKAKFLMFAGPSSSGKTTTTKKIALQLRSRGYETLVISVDDYFKDRVDSPRDENGNYDFECLECLDLKLLNKQLKDLLSGKKVSMPTYNFSMGVKEFIKDPVKLGENQIILMEGLHCINDAMTTEIAPKLKYKVYLSPFIPLNIDRHNYISTTDLRLIRRIVRDNRSRATDVGKTILYWSSVRDGEEKYIFPYINKVNRILNTSLIYELGVLKVFVEPLLYSVSAKSPAYNEARRLIHSLKGFFPIPSDYVGEDSILREFIGGSIFENK
jgi:uridine kinase